ncbi:Putative sterigmatocystin biosynthesis peroxidase stcC [Leucoagaricus sp. SymC.cos]|nr:Putative sterigmatocystin biosynthesis peroxidase stcC [Leucoagaricus sp. SymC.cos]
MSKPDANPQIHPHLGKSCPVTGEHGFCPPRPEDSRSPCPALNTMANHGYINRDGKNVSAWQIQRGLKACYGLSTPLALFLTYVGFAMLKRVRPINLFEIGKHNVIEHNASLVHHDTPEGHEFAPIHIDQSLVDKLINDVKPEKEGDKSGESLMNAVDVARSRIRREKECGPVDNVHAEIARGEMAIILGVWETKSQNKAGIPTEWMRRWIGHEQLPDDWRPTQKQGLLNTIGRSKAIRTAMAEMRKADTSSTATEGTSASGTLNGKAPSTTTADDPKAMQ